MLAVDIPSGVDGLTGAAGDGVMPADRTITFAALKPGLRTRAFAFNTLLADKMVDDRLRSYPHWLASRNLWQ